jgi:hypothetical protein
LHLPAGLGLGVPCVPGGADSFGGGLDVEADEIEQFGIVHFGEGLLGAAAEDGVGGLLLVGAEGVDYLLK